MHEIDLNRLDPVSGALAYLDLGGWTTGGLTYLLIDAIAGLVSSGGAPDYSRTTVMGDMY